MTNQSDEITRLQARVDELDATITRLTTDLADLTAAVIPATADSDPDNPVSESADSRGADPGQTPDPAYATLDAWVQEYFLIVFHRPIGGEIRWCTQWRDHPEAVTRLEALWRSWETLRLDPNLGIATWLTTYLDPQLTALLGRAGTFSQCTPDRHQP